MSALFEMQFGPFETEIDPSKQERDGDGDGSRERMSCLGSKYHLIPFNWPGAQPPQPIFLFLKKSATFPACPEFMLK